MEAPKHTQQERTTKLREWFLNSTTLTVFDGKAYPFLTDEQIKTLTRNYEGGTTAREHSSNNKRYREIINCSNGKYNRFLQ